MAKRAKKKIELFLESKSGSYSIVDQDGKPYTLDEARVAYNTGRVVNYNLSFQRLARLDFDVDALKRYYAEAEAQRRKNHTVTGL